MSLNGTIMVTAGQSRIARTIRKLGNVAELNVRESKPQQSDGNTKKQVIHNQKFLTAHMPEVCTNSIR